MLGEGCQGVMLGGRERAVRKARGKAAREEFLRKGDGRSHARRRAAHMGEAWPVIKIESLREERGVGGR